MINISSITKTESEVVVGEDQHGIPIIDCPEFVSAVVEKHQKFGRFWYKCSECLEECWHEDNGKTYYHKLKCSFSNSIGYGAERGNTTLPHHTSCDCCTCKPPKTKGE